MGEVRRQDDGGGVDRSGEGAATGLVAAGFQPAGLEEWRQMGRMQRCKDT